MNLPAYFVSLLKRSDEVSIKQKVVANSSDLCTLKNPHFGQKSPITDRGHLPEWSEWFFVC